MVSDQVPNHLTPGTRFKPGTAFENSGSRFLKQKNLL